MAVVSCPYDIGRELLRERSSFIKRQSVIIFIGLIFSISYVDRLKTEFSHYGWQKHFLLRQQPKRIKSLRLAAHAAGV